MKKLLVAFAILAMLSSVAFGQIRGADIYGTVVLPDGSAIPGVAVTLTGDVLGTKTTVTSEEGNFRFIQLPPGTYQLKFELEGFKTVINKGIRLYVGKNKNLSVQMETSTIKEEIVITGKTGVVDVRKTTVGVNITQEMLTSLPTARNPWTILNLVPGMMLDREDVGGNESGQQSSFYGLGASSDNTTWNIDGANITDPSAIGAAPGYMNTNSYEEMQVTLGSNDISAQTGGTQLNFVTKRGGNRYSGDFHLYVEDEAWEMTQDLPETITAKGQGSPGVFRLYQYGINFGGPVIKDKLWFFGSYAIQDIHSRTITQSEDTTWLRGMYGKFDFQFGNTSGMFQYANDNKLKWGRTSIGAANQAPETRWNQTGPGGTYLGSIQHVMGNLMLNAKFAYQDGGFTLDPQANASGWMQEMNDGVVGPDMYWYRGPSTWWEGGMEYYTTNRNSLNLSVDGNYFAEGLLGGDHEIRFGVDYYTADTTSQEYYPNHRVLWILDRNDPYGYKQLWWVQDYAFDVGFKRVSFYLSDTATFGKLTANVGLRYDKETGSHNPATSPALLFNGTTPIFTDYMSEVSAIAGTADAAYEVISPRISFTYDITGDGKNVVKASFAQYGSQSGNDIANHTWALGWREIDVYWNDMNGDLVPQIGEWDEDFNTWRWWSIDPYDPYANVSPNKYDKDFNSPVLTELTLAFEKALGEDVAVALNLFYKKTTNILWYRGMFTVDKTGASSGLTYAAGAVETKDNYFEAGTFTFLDGSSKPYYERYYVPNATMLTNHGNGRYNLYTALQLIFSKKLAGGWMFDASFTYADWKQHYDVDEYFDMTNFEYNQDGAVAPESGGSGITGIYVNARWQFKLSGLYQLPWGINVTGVFQAREGYVIPYHEEYERGSGLGWTNMYEVGKQVGDDRLPTFWMLNLGLEKAFKVSDTTTATLFVDGYNITNNATTLKVNTLIGSAQGDIERILNPGLFQFGIRVSF
jgi:hypothetical protein